MRFRRSLGQAASDTKELTRGRSFWVVKRWLVVVCLWSFAATAVPQSQASPQGTVAVSPEMTLHSLSRLVYVDIVVRDAHGAIVQGLKQGDFKVGEDGREQTVTFFDAKSNTGKASGKAAAPQKGAPQRFSNEPDKAGSNSINMVLFDLVDTAAVDQLYARQQMLKFLETLPAGHKVALFVLSDRLHMVQSYTGSSAMLAAAAKLLLPGEHNLVRNEAAQRRDSEEAAYIGRESGRLPSRLGAALELENAREDQKNLSIRLEITAKAFAELARVTSGYSGRKNLFWLAGSFPPATVTALRALGSTLDPTLMNFAGGRQQDQSERAISDSQIAVYPISVLGVETDSAGAEALDASSSGSTFRQFSARQELRAIMNAIAHDTGGQAIYGTNDLTGALSQSLEDGDSYYQIAYQPSNREYKGRYRRINVKLTRPGYHLSYRRGYFAVDEGPPEKDGVRLLNAALQPETPETTMLLLRATAVPVKDKAGTLEVTSTLDVNGVRFTVSPDGHEHARLHVMLVGLAEGGEQADHQPQTSAVLNLNLDADQYGLVKRAGLAFPLQIALGTGHYRLRLGVVDENSRRIGTLDMPVESGP